MKKTVVERGVEVIAVTLLRDDKNIISSTSRLLLKKSELEDANHRLGWQYVLEGFVVHGEHRGKPLGFHAANLDMHDQRRVPTNGVYDEEAVLQHHTCLTALSWAASPPSRGTTAAG